MHEYSIARSILETVAAVRAQRQLGPVAQVDVELGEFSGVEPVQLKSAYADLSPEILGNHSELRLLLVPLRGICQCCQHEFLIVNFQFRCPECDRSEVKILSGEELRIASICVHPEVTIP